tara:strand:+ start:65 stop:715 length:651 start_codon:yes stop_codon:yes gene_type:complete
MYPTMNVQENKKKYNNKLSNLTEIADYYETDKGNIKHLYTLIYENIIGKLKNINLLEIGVAHGSSLKTWSHYYPESKITGIDINPNCEILCKDNDKINIIIDDVLEHKFNENYDVIIDDGSHIPSDIIGAFNKLWDNVKSGGYYIIEDMNACKNKNYVVRLLSYKNIKQEYIIKNLPLNTRDVLDKFLKKISYRNDVKSFNIYNAKKDQICFIEKK